MPAEHLVPNDAEEFQTQREEQQRVLFINFGMRPDFSVHADVYPGEPVPVSWQLRTLLTDLRLEDVITEVQLAGQVIYRSPEPVARVPRYETSSGRSTPSIVCPTDQALAELLYRVGTKWLALSLTFKANGQARGPYYDYAPLTIKAETVDATWWEWMGTDSPQFQWKKSYKLAGKFLHKGRTTPRLNASVTLRELDPMSGMCTQYGSDGSERGPIIIERHLASDVTFPPIVQAWPWHSPLLFWIKAGPETKEFHYTAAWTLADLYGNGYAATSLPLHVKVVVPATKRWLATGAVALTGLSAALFLGGVAVAVVTSAPASAPPVIVAGLSGSLAAGSGATVVRQVLTAAHTTFTSAEKAGAGAVDPPEPDLRFREDVSVTHSPLPRTLAEDGHVATLRPVLEASSQILATYEALGQIEGRFLGARLVGDQPGVRLQREGYQTILADLTAAADRLRDGTPEAIRRLDSDPLFSVATRRFALTILQQEGIPPSIRDAWGREELGSDVLARIEEALRESTIAQATTTIGQQVEATAQALDQLAVEVQQEAPAILSGPDASPPSPMAGY